MTSAIKTYVLHRSSVVTGMENLIWALITYNLSMCILQREKQFITRSFQLVFVTALLTTMTCSLSLNNTHVAQANWIHLWVWCRRYLNKTAESYSSGLFYKGRCLGSTIGNQKWLRKQKNFMQVHGPYFGQIVHEKAKQKSSLTCYLCAFSFSSQTQKKILLNNPNVGCNKARLT